MSKKRGQSAMEMAVLLAGGLIFLTTIIFINQDIVRTVETQFKQTRAQAALDDLTNAAELVYQQGAGAKTRLYVNFPSGLHNLSFLEDSQGNQQRLVFYFVTSGLVERDLDFNISGDFSIEEGSRWITVESLSTQFVNFSGEY
ncbi:hypothetical protein HYT51_01140 [Candidatus Woesearchaeota archaeon]|nr:hypothetical protein [Candidatus Woesearchaeota archaeon]